MSRTWWNPYSSDSFRLRSPLPPDVCRERLASLVIAFMEGTTFERKPLGGRVTAKGFTVWLRRWERAAVAPVARGVWVPTAMGTDVSLGIGSPTRGRVFVGVVLAFVVIFGLLAEVNAWGASAPAERWTRALETLTGPGVFLALLVVGLFLASLRHRHDSVSLLDILKGALSADPAPDTPVE